MSVQPISDLGRQILVLVCQAGGPLRVADIAARLKRPEVADEVAKLVQAGSLVARGSLTPAQLQAEAAAALARIQAAQRTGGTWTFRTANQLAVAPSETGRAMAALLSQPRPRDGRPGR